MKTEEKVRKQGKHTLDEVLRSLSKKKDIRISFEPNICEILTDKIYDNKKDCLVDNPQKSFDLGNGSWGKIDFLKEVYNFKISKVSSFKR